MRGPTLRKMTSRVPALGIVQASVKGLQKRDGAMAIGANGIPESFPNTRVDAVQVADDKRGRKQDDEKHQHDEVKNREADDTSLAKLRLLERVDRGADLTTARGISN